MASFWSSFDRQFDPSGCRPLLGVGIPDTRSVPSFLGSSQTHPFDVEGATMAQMAPFPPSSITTYIEQSMKLFVCLSVLKSSSTSFGSCTAFLNDRIITLLLSMNGSHDIGTSRQDLNCMLFRFQHFNLHACGQQFEYPCVSRHHTHTPSRCLLYNLFHCS
jgi:hypothetical protein